MAVVVRRWSLQEEDGGENTCRFPHSSTAIEVDAVQSGSRSDNAYRDKSASVSLDHKYLVVTRTADSSRKRRTLHLDLWLLRERKSPLSLPGDFLAQDFVWRAVRHMPSVASDAHIPIPRPIPPSERLGDAILVLTREDGNIHFIRMSSRSPSPPPQLLRPDETLVGAFSEDHGASDSSHLFAGSFLWRYADIVHVMAKKKLALPSKHEDCEIKLHAYSYDTDAMCLSIFELDEKRTAFLVGIARVEVTSNGVHLISASCISKMDVEGWQTSADSSTDSSERPATATPAETTGSGSLGGKHNINGIAVKDVYLEGHFFWVYREDNTILIIALSLESALVGIVDVNWVVQKRAEEGNLSVDAVLNCTTLNVSPNCASIGVGVKRDARDTCASIFVINLDEYFRARPCDCDWDTLGLASPLWASHGLCEGWHDVYTAGRPLFARAIERERGKQSVEQIFPKVMHNNYDPDVKEDDAAERANCKYRRIKTAKLLKSTRVGVLPRTFHWYNRFRPQKVPAGLHMRRAISTIDTTSKKRSPPEDALRLVGEEDKLLQSISGGDGYGGHGLDVVYGVPRGVGVRVPSYRGSVHQYGQDVADESLPAWDCRTAAIQRLEPTLQCLNGFMKPGLSSLNGFTRTTQRPKYARAQSMVRGEMPKELSFTTDLKNSFSLPYESSKRPTTLNTPRCSELYVSIDQMSGVSIGKFTVTADTVIMETRDLSSRETGTTAETESLLTRFSRQYRKAHKETLPSSLSVTIPLSSVPLVYKNHAWYYLNSTGMHAVIFPSILNSALSKKKTVDALSGTSEQRKLIDKFIVFSVNTAAEHLCRINEWHTQMKRISIIALEIGLLHHELPVVERSLKSLEGDLRLQGNRMLMHYVRTNWATFQDRNSFNRLLRVAQDFVTRLIDSEATTLGVDDVSSRTFSKNILFAKSYIASGSLSQTNDASIGASLNILQLMSDLAELREIEFYLNHRKQDIPSMEIASPQKIVDSPSKEHQQEEANKLSTILESEANTYSAGHFPLPQVSHSIQMIEEDKNALTEDPMRVLPIPSMRYNWQHLCWEGQVHSEEEWATVELAQLDEDVLGRSMKRRERRNKSAKIRTSISDDHVVVSSGIREDFETWSQLHDEEIVRRCLLNGRVAAALAFLAARRLGRVQSPEDIVSPARLQAAQGRRRSAYMYHVVDGAAEANGQLQTEWEIQGGDAHKFKSPILMHKAHTRHMHGVGFDWFRYVGGRHIYQKLGDDNSELFLASLMLRNLGENVSEFFKDVAFHTSRRTLRWRLIRHLAHTAGIGAEEMDTIEFVQLLESLHPNGCYTSEYQRRWSGSLNGTIPVWDYNWVGKRTKYVENDVLKRWPRGGLGDESDPAYVLGIGDYTDINHPVRPLAPSSVAGNMAAEASRGVGCGYIVKIDLAGGSEDVVLDDGYATDASESEDDTLAEEEYMIVAPPSSRVDGTEEYLEKWISCGDVQDLGATRMQHQPGAAQHVAARDGPQSIPAGSGYYDRKGNQSKSGASISSGHWSSRDDAEAVNVKEYRTRVCKRCLRHRPSAPMVLWMRERCGRQTGLKRHNSLLDEQSDKDLTSVAGIRHEIQTLSEHIAIWRVHVTQTGDVHVAKQINDAERERVMLMSKLEYQWRSAESNDRMSKSIKGNSSKDCLDNTPMWMPWIDNGAYPEEEGYLYIALAWAHSWDMQTRERILIERGYCLKQRSVLAYLPYAVAHNDWRGVVRWIHEMPLQGGSVNSLGEFCVESPSNATPFLTHLVSFVSSVLPRATGFMKELITVEFAKRGIFVSGVLHRGSAASTLPSFVDKTHQSADLFATARETKAAFVYNTGAAKSPKLRRRKEVVIESPSFSKLMQVLCKCRLLFAKPSYGQQEINSLSLRELLPTGKPSPFHKYFIAFCIQKGFLHVLREYLDHYQLGMNAVSLRALGIDPSRPWAKLLLTGRIGHTGRLEIFEAAVHNGLFCLDHSRNRTSYQDSMPNVDENNSLPVNAMLAGQRPLMAIGTLMYAPVASLDEVMVDDTSATDFPKHPWNVNRTALETDLRSYPSLHKTLFAVGASSHDVHKIRQNKGTLKKRAGDIMTWKGDVSLFDLLSDTVPFSLDSVFGTVKLAGSTATLTKKQDIGVIKHFSSTKFKTEAYVERRGALYYLSKGWPMQAFHHMFAKKADGSTQEELSVAELHEALLQSGFEQQSKHGISLQLSPDKQSRIRAISRQATLYNLLKPSVLAASSCFLDLCSLENVRETLQVDSEAATRIYEWRLRVALKKKDGVDVEDVEWSRELLNDDILHEVAQLFISFPKSKDPEDPAVNKALALLGEATRDLVGDVTNTDSGAVLAWKLVSVFCRAHGLKTSIALLQELARRDDCITFLHEAQREHFMPNEIVDIVLNNFTDPCLRDHMYIVAQNMASSDAGGKQTQLEDKAQNTFFNPDRQHVRIEEADAILEGSTSKDDVFDILFECSRDDHPGLALLDVGLTTKRPQLAVLATCFPETPTLDCLVIWLAVQQCCERVPLSWLPWASSGISNTGSPNSEPDTEPLIKLTTVIGRHNCSLRDFQIIISWLCRRHEFGVLRTAFRIFDPQNIALDFLLFYETFRLRQYRTAALHMESFVAQIKNSNYTLDSTTAEANVNSKDNTKIGDVLIAKQLAEDEIAHLLDVTVKEETPFQCEKLLTILAESKFSDKYVQLHDSFSILQRVRLSLATMEHMPASLSDNLVLHSSIQEYGVWTPPEKMLELLIAIQWFDEARLYTTCGLHDLGVEYAHNVTGAEVHALLNTFHSSFLWKIESERSLFWEQCMNLFQVQSYPKERAGRFFGNLTLRFSLEISGSEHVQLLKLARQLLTSKETVISESEALFFENLDTQILMISTGNDVNAGTGFSTLPSVFADEVVTNEVEVVDEEALRYLEIVVTEMINREQLEEADRVCKRYNYSNHDLIVIREAINAVVLDQSDPLKALGAVAAKGAGERIRLAWSVKQQLRLPYHEVLAMQPDTTLAMLLSLIPVFRVATRSLALVPTSAVPKNKILSICSDYIRHFKVDASTVAETFSTFFFDSIIESYENSQTSGTVVNDWRVEDLDEYVVGVAQAPRELGDDLLLKIREGREGKLAAASKSPLWQRCDAELLTIAHFCHVQACNVRGIQACIETIAERAKVYARSGNYKVLVRLMAGTQEYRRLEFIFDIVAGQNKLGLFIEATSGNDYGLKNALDEYMRAYHSLDMERLVGTYRRFEMYREIGELLRDKALAMMDTLAGEGGEETIIVVQLFIQSARFFLKEDCFQQAHECLLASDRHLEKFELKDL